MCQQRPLCFDFIGLCGSVPEAMQVFFRWGPAGTVMKSNPDAIETVLRHHGKSKKSRVLPNACIPYFASAHGLVSTKTNMCSLALVTLALHDAISMCCTSLCLSEVALLMLLVFFGKEHRRTPFQFSTWLHSVLSVGASGRRNMIVQILPKDGKQEIFVWDCGIQKVKWGAPKCKIYPCLCTDLRKGRFTHKKYMAIQPIDNTQEVVDTPVHCQSTGYDIHLSTLLLL